MKNIIIDGVEYNITPVIKKEKDYKILSLARFCSIKPTITDVSDYGDEFIEAMLKCDKARIHSIKRLSDNQIFTIGDKLIYPNSIPKNHIFVIDEFRINRLGDNRLTIGHGTANTYLNEDFKKVKQPLFQTFDKVDIFEGDKYYLVLKKEWKIPLNPENPIINNTFKENNNYWYFSTKEKAEEYVLMNKPCLSINDVAKVFISTNYTTNKGNLYPQGQKLRDLVKQKLK